MSGRVGDGVGEGGTVRGGGVMGWDCGAGDEGLEGWMVHDTCIIS